MRPIDADELKKELSNKDYITYTHEYGDAIPVDWIMSAIDNAPTVEPTFREVVAYECGQKSVKELKSIEPEDYRRSFTAAMCGDCKYADVPRNRKPCCSCEWLERECYYEEVKDGKNNS